MILKGLVDRDDIARLSRCGREPSDRRQYEERDKSDLAARSRYNDFTPQHLSHGGGTIHGRKYGEKFPRLHGLKKAGRSNDVGVVLLSPTRRRAERSLVAWTLSPDLFVHARELLVEANRFGTIARRLPQHRLNSARNVWLTAGGEITSHGEFRRYFAERHPPRMQFLRKRDDFGVSLSIRFPPAIGPYMASPSCALAY
jgi:hypothetical protein